MGVGLENMVKEAIEGKKEEATGLLSVRDGAGVGAVDA